MAKFGTYELLERIGCGGMGEIFLALLRREDAFEKLLVIKRILPTLSADPEFVTMFNREARIAALLNHQNIVQVYDYGREGDEYYIAMELVDGADLRTLQHLSGSPPSSAAYTILSGVARALDYAHRLRDRSGKPMHLVHRDVSPGNVLLSREGEVKLTDFGLVTSGAAEFSTDGGALKGKYAYMSPEQTYGDPLDARSDLFSWGILAYELIAGTRPFQGPIVEIVRAIQQLDFEPLATDAVPPRLVGLIHQCLLRHPDERPESAAFLLSELDQVALEAGWIDGTKRLGEWVRPGCRSTIAEAVISSADRTAVGASPIRARSASDTPPSETRDPQADDAIASTLSHAPAVEVPGRRRSPWIAVAVLLVVGGAAAAVGLRGGDSDPGDEPPQLADLEAPQNLPIERLAVVVRSRPEGATIRVDGVDSGQTPLQLDDLPPNQRITVESTLPGHGTVPRTFRPEDLPEVGDSGVRLLELIHLPEPATLRIESNAEGAAIYLDGRLEGTAPLDLQLDELGSHELRVEAEGYASHTRTIEVAPGDALVIPVDIPRLYLVRIDSDPTGTQVVATPASGEESSCLTPCELSTPEGPLTVVASREGFRSVEQTRQVSADQTITMQLDEVRRSMRLRLRRGALLGRNRDIDLSEGRREETIHFQNAERAFSGAMSAVLSPHRSDETVGAQLSFRTTPWSRVRVGPESCSTPCSLQIERMGAGAHDVEILPEGQGEPLVLGMRLQVTTE